MKTCIYYEQEAVSADDAPRALAGSGESAPAGAIGSADISGGPPSNDPAASLAEDSSFFFCKIIR
jgi:hypothetical protein